MRRLPIRLAVCLSLLSTVVAMNGLAGEVTWVGPTNSRWDIDSNWSTGQPPEPSDNVTITGSNVTVRDARVVNGSLTVNGGALLVVATVAGSLTANGPTTIDDARLQSSGGAVLSLPNVTSYRFTRCDRDQALFTAGGGGLIDMPNLVSIELDAANCPNLINTIVVTANGMIDFSGLETISTTDNQRIAITLLSNGMIDFSSLATADSISLLVDQMSAIDFPMLTDLADSSLGVNAGGSLTANALINGTGLSLNPGGQDTLFANALESLVDSVLFVPMNTQFRLNELLTAVDTSITIGANALFEATKLGSLESTNGLHLMAANNGAMVSLPSLDSARNYLFTTTTGGMLNLSSMESYTWDICQTLVPFFTDGAGSLIDASGIRTWTVEPQGCPSLVAISSTANNGALLDLSGLRTIVIAGAHSVSFLAMGQDGIIDLSALQTFPVLQVSFFEFTDGEIRRFSGGGGDNGGMMCAASIAGRSNWLLDLAAIAAGLGVCIAMGRGTNTRRA